MVSTPAATLADIVTNLNNPDDKIRTMALIQLARQYPDQARESLLNGLTDRHCRVRSQAAEELGKLGERRAVPLLLAALHDKKPQMRTKAIYALEAIGDASAVEPLIALLKDPKTDRHLRFHLTRVVSVLGGDQSIDVLLPLITSQDESCCQIAISGLGRIGTERAADVLLALLKNNPPLWMTNESHPTWWMTHELTSSLVEIGGERISMESLALLHEQTFSRKQRVILASALGRLKCMEAVEPLIELLQEPQNEGDGTDIKGVIEALGQLGDRRAVPFLLPFLKQDVLVRSSTARALQHLNDPQAADALFAALSDPQDWSWSYDYMLDALVHLGDSRALELVLQMLASPPRPSYDTHKTILQLEVLGDPRAIEPLRTMSRKAPKQLRLVIARVVDHLSTKM